ncbi:MAG TPA: aminopeptidase [Burkholderiaceae bacterium]
MRRFLLALLTLCLSGCADLSYLGQSVGGHLRLMSAARPVDEWLADDATSPALRARLQLSQRMRDYAITELHLPDNRSYRSYADLHRSAAVWNVVAAPELSLSPKTWCFPIMGCVSYRGYFDQAAAKQLGDQLKAEGWEVVVYPVPAYSTLGWTADPLLNTFVGYPEGTLAGMIFHELAHQVAYAADDTAFNESFATAVQEMGADAWLQSQGSEQAREAYRVDQARRAQFAALTHDYQARLTALYAGQQSDADKRAAKAKLMSELRADYGRLKAESWQGYAGYDNWFAQANNASLAILASYSDGVPDFKTLFEREGRDWPRFYAEVKRLAALPKAQRHAELTSEIR